MTFRSLLSWSRIHQVLGIQKLGLKPDGEFVLNNKILLNPTRLWMLCYKVVVNNRYVEAVLNPLIWIFLLFFNQFDFSARPTLYLGLDPRHLSQSTRLRSLDGKEVETHPPMKSNQFLCGYFLDLHFLAAQIMFDIIIRISCHEWINELWGAARISPHPSDVFLHFRWHDINLGDLGMTFVIPSQRILLPLTRTSNSCYNASLLYVAHAVKFPPSLPTHPPRPPRNDRMRRLLTILYTNW